MDCLFFTYTFYFIQLLAIAILVIYWLWYSDDLKSYPKGPKRFPLIGSYVTVRKLMDRLWFSHLVLDHLSKQYGEVFAVKVGRVEAVIVSGKEMVQRVMDDDAFNSRPSKHVFRMRAFYESLGTPVETITALGRAFSNNYIFNLFNKYFRGPIVDSSKWTEHEQLLLLYFYVATLGGETVIEYFQEELGNILLNIEEMSRHGKAISIFGVFDVAMVNVYWKMIAGKRFELNDPNLKKFMNLIQASFQLMDEAGGLCGPINQMPFLRYKKLKNVLNTFHAFLKESVDKHWVHPNNYFIRIILNEIEKLKRQEQSAEDYLLVTLLDIFLIGTETTGSTVGFAILALIQNPSVQAKVYAELKTVVGRRDVQIADIKRLPYLEAVMMEVQRHNNVVPLSIAHKTVRDTILKEYTIPKGTMVMASLYSVHMDENHWGDPLVFRPERFLDEVTGEVVTDDWFIPFGIGGRKCPGEQISKNYMSLILGTIFQKYHVIKPPGVQLPEYPQEGITLSPSPFTAIFNPRPPQ